MRFTIIGDPHITHKSLDRAAALFSLVEEIKLPCIWLGDLLDTKEVIRGKCLNAAIEYFKSSKLTHYVLVGNHDWFNLECEAHALEALKLLPNVKVIDQPFAMETLDIVMIPYFHDKDKLKEVLTQHKSPNTVLIGHLELSDFDFGNGHICTTGLSLSDVAGFKRVISGHFHKYQTRENLTYLGTPFSHTFGEANQVKYIGMYDKATDELKIAETPFPKHISVEYDCDDLGREAPISEDASTENFYRVILTGKQANIDQFPRHLFERFNVKWITRPSDFVENDVVIDETASNEKQFVRWAKDIKRMDADTVKLGLEILETCR